MRVFGRGHEGMGRAGFTLMLGAIVSVVALFPGEVSSQSGGRDQVCVYEHAGYGGWEGCYGVGEQIPDLGDARNSISAVRVQGHAEITLYQHPNFQAREVALSSSVSDLKQQVGRFWNDEVDSLRVSSPTFRGRPNREERRAERV